MAATSTPTPTPTRHPTITKPLLSSITHAPPRTLSFPTRRRFTSARCCCVGNSKPNFGHWSLTARARSNPRLDFEHWFVRPKREVRKGATEQEFMDRCIKILATVVGSEKEAKKRIYEYTYDWDPQISSRPAAGFSCKVDWETHFELEELPDVSKLYAVDNPDPEFKGFPERDIVISIKEEKMR